LENQNLLYQIALTLIPGIGAIKAKKIIAYCGDAEAVFKSKKKELSKIPAINSFQTESIISKNIFVRAEKEIEFIIKNQIKPLFYTDKDYPNRLKYCEDSPILLYFKGNCDLNAAKIISIVGTRKATEYGKEICRKILEDLRPYNPLIVSGLAYGIDICAHKLALSNNLSTIACLGHGLDKIYPSIHQATAQSMLEKGGLLTEFLSQTDPDRENFPKRNRIVAGIADATLVIEAGIKGGALITAEIANSYNRDVFAVPGRLNDEYSQGCNHLIKTHKAALISSVKDIEYVMGWEQNITRKIIQQKLFVELNPEEELLLKILKENKSVSIDKLSLLANFNISKTAATLLKLEFSGMIKVLPGKIYELN
jgi:DNA processing protein